LSTRVPASFGDVTTAVAESASAEIAAPARRPDQSASFFMTALPKRIFVQSELLASAFNTKCAPHCRMTQRKPITYGGVR
jgi:hypothetical protein